MCLSVCQPLRWIPAALRASAFMCRLMIVSSHSRCFPFILGEANTVVRSSGLHESHRSREDPWSALGRVGRQRQFVFVASRRIEYLGDQLAHGRPIASHQVGHLGELQRRYDHDARVDQNRSVFRKARFMMRRPGEWLEEPARVGDNRATQFSRSRNSSDSSPSFVCVTQTATSMAVGERCSTARQRRAGLSEPVPKQNGPPLSRASKREHPLRSSE